MLIDRSWKMRYTSIISEQANNNEVKLWKAVQTCLLF